MVHSVEGLHITRDMSKRFDKLKKEKEKRKEKKESVDGSVPI